MIDRIKKIMVEENMTSSKFADEIGIINSRLSHYLSGRNNVTLDLIMKILERFRGINPDWLMFGRGEMYKSPESKPVNVERDLFSTPSVDNLPGQVDDNAQSNILESSDLDSDNEPIDETNDVQTPEPQQVPVVDDLKAIKQTGARKKIEKILVMYDDSTFDCYTPSGQHI